VRVQVIRVVHHASDKFEVSTISRKPLARQR